MTNIDDSGAAPSEHGRVTPASSSTGSEPVEICAGCHLPLTRRGPKGECLRCLIDFAFSPDYEESLANASSGGDQSSEQALRYGHFEIAIGADGHPVELGAGAMATTYRAVDSVLHSAVALKVINQKVAEHPAARARFLREARAAARLHHPNVASVSHYGEQDGECYYVMELVEGETLEARVRREGPLPTALVLEIGIQVARALAAAEACGVMHRDLKPSNIMLTTPQGEKMGSASIIVKVIDWGLAKAVSADSALGADHTHGGFVGTPAFASPEQFSRAEDRRVDTRSDIYSLGVTLWYLLCGRTPFVGSTLEEIHSQQVKRPIPFAQLAAARAPGRVVALLKSMMAVDPAARPQSARELLDELRDCREHLPCEEAPRRVRHAYRRRLVFAPAALLLLLMAAAGAWWRHLESSRAPVDKSVAVLPLEDISPDPAANAVGALDIQDRITSGLARIAGLKVIGRDSVKEYVPGKRNLPAIGRALGVGHLLEGSVRRQAGKIHLKVWLVNALSGAREWDAAYDMDATETFALESRVTSAVATALGAPPSAAEAAAINRPPTRNLQAYDLYLRSQTKLRMFPNAEAMLRENYRAIGLLEEAVKLDPEFALAYAKLGAKHDNLTVFRNHFPPEERAIDHRALAEAAYAKARQLQPDLAELHLYLGAHFFDVNHDMEQAQIEFDLAQRALPNDPYVETQVARTLRIRGHLEEAITHYRRAIELDPRDVGNRAEIYTTYGYLRLYDDYDREIAALIALLPPDQIPELSLCRAIGPLARGADLAPLRKALAELPKDWDPGGTLQDAYGLLLALFDHDPQAVDLLVAFNKEEEILISDFPYPRSWFTALAARMRGDADAARAAFTAARADVEKNVQADPQNERVLLLLAMIDAGLGKKDEAVQEARRGCAMQTENLQLMDGPSNRCCLAVVYAWTGQPDQALAELEKLAGEPAGENTPDQVTYGDLKLNPVWDPLRDNPRFAALTERLAPSAKH